ncbi:MAG: penicillin-binding protein [Candidatus Kaiserbacteria bacterium]|nr:MAG: penicillin-binding protein [Candidatus Kaiserbacteria bacterium]
MWRKLKRLWRKMPLWAEMSILTLAAIVFIGLGSAIVWATVVPIPSINNFENRKVAESTKIYDRTGNIVLYDVHGTMRRTAVPLDQISPYVQKATIAIEDATFYEHKGFRPLAFVRAVIANLTTGSFSQGGSTITQQVVKNALLTQDKTIVRKLKEIILALRLERVYDKDQILNTYLNENPYGGTVYGVEEASQYFFGVSAKDVDLAQAAYLAALPQAPTYYSPYGNHRDDLDTRQKYVLKRMLDLGMITQEEHDNAAAEAITFRDRAEAGIKAPHFVFYIREYLEQKYGVDAVNQDGLKVVTTLDYDLQKEAERIVAEDAPGMEANFNASNMGVVAIEPKSGQVLTMVGSRGYFDETIDGKVNVATSYQQPGSSFKPIVYATALEKGYTPETVVFDTRTQFSTACPVQDIFNSTPPCYSPVSFDDKYRGPVTFRSALAQSLNIPAVKALYLVGIDAAINTAQRLGITTLGEAGRYGLSLVLGGGDITLLELTGAYAVFANDGVQSPTTAILRVEDKNGKILESYEDRSNRVLDQQVARQINDILSDNVARTPEFGANSPLYFPGYNVAAKTGTTNDYWDVWILGYTPGVSVGAWAGNNDNTPMVKQIAAFIISPTWHKIMQYALERYPSEDFSPPAPETDSLPPVLRGESNTDPSQGIHEILYWIDKDNPRGGRPANPYADSQFTRWDYPVSSWGFGSSTVSGLPQLGVSNGFMITSPQNGSFVSALAPLTITAAHPNPASVSRVAYYLNGVYLGASVSPPYAISASLQARGPAQLRAVADTAGGLQETTISITVQ